MNQQEIRSKYYLHSDVLHLETADFFSFLQKRYYGMGSKEGFDKLFELAKELHAEVG